MDICKFLSNFAQYFDTPPIGRHFLRDMTILFTTHLPDEGFTRLSEHKLLIPSSPYFTLDELKERIVDADILVSTYDYSVPAELLSVGQALKLVANFGVGFNNIDLAYCRMHGILVTNTPQPVIEPTAEHCWTLMHAVAHRTAELDRKLRQQNSPSRLQERGPESEAIRFGVMNNLGVSLYGKTLGIIGMGRIGQAVARRAIASGMRVVYHNRHHLSLDIENRYQARYLSMDELLATSDYVSLNLPYTPEVHHLIDSEALHKMKPSAILINTARGAHIDEAALVEALQNGTIRAAALDVYEHEPAITPELFELDNVVLSPHIGTGTIDGRLDMCRNVVDNILSFVTDDLEHMNIV